jgi:hypothetical protein
MEIASSGPHHLPCVVHLAALDRMSSSVQIAQLHVAIEPLADAGFVDALKRVVFPHELKWLSASECGSEGMNWTHQGDARQGDEFQVHEVEAGAHSSFH